MGRLIDIGGFGVGVNPSFGESYNSVVIMARYSKGRKTYSLELVKEGGTWKVRKYEVQ